MMHADVATAPCREGFKVRITFFDDERVLATYGGLMESEDEAERMSSKASGYLTWFGIEVETRTLRSAA
jgi:hypothetical protein